MQKLSIVTYPGLYGCLHFQCLGLCWKRGDERGCRTSWDNRWIFYRQKPKTEDKIRKAFDYANFWQRYFLANVSSEKNLATRSGIWRQSHFFCLNYQNMNQSTFFFSLFISWNFRINTLTMLLLLQTRTGKKQETNLGEVCPWPEFKNNFTGTTLLRMKVGSGVTTGFCLLGRGALLMSFPSWFWLFSGVWFRQMFRGDSSWWTNVQLLVLDITESHIKETSGCWYHRGSLWASCSGSSQCNTFPAKVWCVRIIAT